jgi:mRNA interferase MazF
VFAFGSIVLTRFPFTDLSGDKRRPALVVSRDNDRRLDLVVCFITSVPRAGPDMAAIAATPGTGLKIPSVVRFDKLATLDRAVIAGRLGEAPAEWLAAHRGAFFDVFGFGEPTTQTTNPHGA